MTTAETAQLHDGRYRIERELGSGGMARVVLAHDASLGRPVALKMPAPHIAADAVFLERFRREAVATASLGHPNVVAVYDRGSAGGVPYIAMEYVEGRTLKQIVDADGPLPEAVAARLVVQALHALEFAHARGVVHRDIKPQNMVVRGDGHLKVMDFGIARSTGGEPGLTEVGSVLGTAQYLSPEQARGQPAEPASDIYAMGVVLFEMLTGTLPFAGDSHMAIAAGHANDPAPSARSRNKEVSPAMSAVVARALEKDPARRFASAAAMAAAVAAAAAPAPAATTGATRVLPSAAAAAPTMVVRRARRRWAPIALVLAVLAGLGLLYATWGGSAPPAPTAGTTQNRTTTPPARPAPVRVPAGIVGQPWLTVARPALAAAGLTNLHPHYAYTKTAPKGQVVAMNPQPGTSVDPSSPIFLTVSLGPKERHVPPGHRHHHHHHGGGQGNQGGD